MGTESHCARLELLLTDFVLSELSREGSTFYRPDAMSKDEEDTHEGKGGAGTKAVPKKGPKKKAGQGEELEPKPKKSKKPKKREADEKDEEAAEEIKQPKAKKPKKEAKDEDEEDGDESSELW